MRLFFALPVDQGVALEIAQWRDRALLPQERWVSPANYHMTLSFIGELKSTHYEALCEGCDELAAGLTDMGESSLVINQTGYWPKQSIMWVGPSTWSDQLSVLQQRLAQLNTRFGVKRSKKNFQPHITLSRKCPQPPLPLVPPDFRVSVRRFVLYESVQMRSGVQYQERESWSLTRLSNRML